MTRDTFMDALEGGGSDGVPMFIRDMTLGMDVTDVDTTDVFGKTFDPELSAECIHIAALQARLNELEEIVRQLAQ